MNYQILDVKEESNVCLVTINRPQALNALNTQTMDELEFFFIQDAPNRMNIKGIVLTGAGEKGFVAGADIKEFLGLGTDGGKNMAQKGHDIFDAIERFPKPVIAAINGFALGGGCELAMACHLRVASEKARFGQPEVSLGIIPGYGGTQRLVRYAGKTKALELLMTGDMFSAQQALEWGVVNYVVIPGDEVAKSIELVEKIASKGPIAVSKVIESVNAYFDGEIDSFKKEIELFGYTTTTEDFKEGASAFVEKRKADFKGH